MVNGSPVSTGTFTVNGSGNLSLSSFPVPSTQLAAATKFILTIEPSPDNNAMPAATKYLAGDFSEATRRFRGGRCDVDERLQLRGRELHPGVAIGWPHGSLWARHLVAHPADSSPTLMLPMLPDGWMYEGWVVVKRNAKNDGPIQSGDGRRLGRGGACGRPDGHTAIPGAGLRQPAQAADRRRGRHLDRTRAGQRSRPVHAEAPGRHGD